LLVLAINSAYAGCSVALVEDGIVAQTRHFDQDHGLAAALPGLVRSLLIEAGASLDLIAACVGPGSFTGLRAGLSVATGLGLALGIQLVGVTTAEALRAELHAPGRQVWIAMEARRDRIFVDTGAGPCGYDANYLPGPVGPVAIAGNAATFVAAALAARNADVMLTSLRQPSAASIAAIGVRRAAGEIPQIPPLPLYVDAPEARLPAGGLRQAPEPAAR
jgi:tRNA threonylcarbamoyl adenosine modification protein YeaZ